MQPESPRQRRHQRRHRVGTPSLVLEAVFSDERAADDRAARVAEGLRREALALGLHEREPRDLVADVEREPREDAAAELARAGPVAREAEPVVHAPAAAEDRAGGGGDVDRTAPGTGQAPAGETRE